MQMNIVYLLFADDGVVLEGTNDRVVKVLDRFGLVALSRGPDDKTM